MLWHDNLNHRMGGECGYELELFTAQMDSDTLVLNIRHW